ncbi:MAG: metal ABC transporter ATP-binding protein [Puniceicoccaceae bacterium]
MDHPPQPEEIAIPPHAGSRSLASSRADPEHRLEVIDLHVHYGSICALSGVSLALRPGDLCALLGPNGAGKSTLLKTLAGLVSKPSGKILWRGAPLTPAVRQREFAYLPQREEVDWNFPLSVRGLVEMGRFPILKSWRRFRRADHQAVDQALDLLDLRELADRQISELSGGQQQRAFLARALAGEAKVLLLDEPFGGLDQEATKRLNQVLRQLADRGHLVLTSIHEVGSIQEHFDLALLLRTQPIAFGEVSEVLRHYLSSEAAP